MCHFFEVVSVMHINKRCRTLWINDPSHVNQKSVYGVPDQNGLKSIFPTFLKTGKFQCSDCQCSRPGSELRHSPGRLVAHCCCLHTKTQFSRDEAHFSVSYEMNDRKKLSQHVFERIIIRFSGKPI